MTQSTQQPHRAFSKRVNSVLGQCLFVVLVIVTMTIYWQGLQSNHQRKISALENQTQLRSAQLAQTLAVQVHTLFASLDFVAQNLVAEYAQGNSEGFALAVKTATETYPPNSILQIAVANAKGDVVFSNLPNSSQASIADRKHFLVHANATDSGLYISYPLMGRVSKLWTIQLSRPIRTYGAFDGVVVVSVAPSYLSSFFRSILDQPNDVIMLLHEDGAYMARSHAEETVLGKFISKDWEFFAHQELAQGYYDTISPIDGVERHYAWHRVGAFPLLVSIGLDKEAIWQPVLQEIRQSETRNAIVSALLLIVTFVISWLSWQERKAKAQAARSQALLSSFVTQVPGALFQLHIQSNNSVSISYVTPSLYSLHQLHQGAEPSAIWAKIHADDRHRMRTELGAAVVSQEAWQGTYRVNADSESTRWMRYTVKPEMLTDDGVLLHGYVQDITQEQEMQQTLRSNEQRLRLTMEAVNDGLWQWCLKSHQVHWDARCWAMLGYTEHPTHLTRDILLEWMHPNDRERFLSILNAHLEHQAHYHCEFRLRNQQGHWVWVEARGNVTDFEDGSPIRMLGTHTDISDRVSQTQLRRVLLDESAAAILLATPDRVIVQANRRAKQMFSSGEATLSGQSLRVLHPSDESFQAFSDCYEELRSTGYVRREWLYQLSNGRQRWCDIHGTLLDPQDIYGQIIWTIIDIDDRYRAEAELRIAQKRLAAIIERFPGGVMVQEKLYGPIVAINPELSEILGLPPSATSFPSTLEQRIREILPAAMLEPPMCSEAETDLSSLRAEQTVSDGRTFEVHRIPLCDQAQSLGLFWLLRDITEDKQRESALEQLASTDALTALPNRRAFMARLQQEFNAVGKNTAQPGILIMLDIDFFKKVNDTWGHAIGDQVLKHLSALLRQSLRLRNGDMAGRLGGEEFGILLAATDLQGGTQLAERLREIIASTPALTEQGPISFTASLGVSILDQNLLSIDQGLERADAALYYSKRHGRNQVSVWTPEMVMTQSAATAATSN